ncbi:hypothetical protein EZH22_14295 [Xanthobacter dioxanivorans]|uniref:Uncharacterized protein n=1 Tax=Xanthobacter dioxanivorans TaxID=2528964 RepID=A0A974PTA1_9HYPH|nr:hypothetical protein [Xanthobacter dioxanivorans]QRG09315.1 hypothetical protein EZH22_14295 [Xanthobacter dioxanivorans]
MIVGHRERRHPHRGAGGGDQIVAKAFAIEPCAAARINQSGGAFVQSGGGTAALRGLSPGTGVSDMPCPIS